MRATTTPARTLSPWALPILAVVAVLAVAGTEVFSQSSDDIKVILKEIEALKQGQAAIQKDLQDLKALLQRPRGAADPPPVAAAIGKAMVVAGHPFKGREDAPLTLVEFSDFQCPFCSRHVNETLPQIEREYVKTGKVKYVFRNFPLESIHKQAFNAAEAAACAQAQGRYWEMHRRLFANQAQLMPDQLLSHGQALGLNAAAFQQCLSGSQFAARVRQDLNDGMQIGVTGTPAFFVGRTKPGEPGIQIAAVVSGAKPFASFKETLDRLLGQ